MRRPFSINAPHIVPQNLKILREKIGKKRLKTNVGGGHVGLSSNDKAINTQKEIAKEHGMSTGKVAQAEILMREASEEIKEKLRADLLSSNDKKFEPDYNEI